MRERQVIFSGLSQPRNNAAETLGQKSSDEMIAKRTFRIEL